MSHAESHDRQHPTLTLGVLSLSALAYILLQSMVLPALPEIGHALHTSQSTVAWVLTAYSHQRLGGDAGARPPRRHVRQEAGAPDRARRR